ncbi:hypothetical protein BDB00DRAFT_879007 [Zychaea mexicana]|uniref:uncharacterized protein n=1 Tax=Zychaea mexicana TaxID=64656 RepID=UPI0022FE7249|nr:uncharacterized protein BDB00DRAFT_879007 [Zychaea mexicana]KAI9484278.1 hypothetical protein BDB00DRAFT_879007 [Zychaea mexicana]
MEPTSKTRNFTYHCMWCQQQLFNRDYPRDEHISSCMQETCLQLAETKTNTPRGSSDFSRGLTSIVNASTLDRSMAIDGNGEDDDMYDDGYQDDESMPSPVSPSEDMVQNVAHQLSEPDQEPYQKPALLEVPAEDQQEQPDYEYRRSVLSGNEETSTKIMAAFMAP